ncbi:TRAP transporter substrate-binding protein (plasmid) [Paracoccus versutus]|uniref:Tripartite ATP-independent transporter DctP family solute receptor n=1 Tax=Paracoccus versutus TaxID=34007 RepID=A0AAQ0HJD2_PARVE|nr:TRAP transporter substrate-binding protein [Paracoccus versutus]REG54229.1 tripartite ATP-independent transporter DctP family solute receptor [Paracoccus versutus]WEJ80378.1 TRAP transporter substrate-binding protein [Paracoccus versutus]
MITLNRRRFAALAVACLTAASAMGASAAELTLKLGHLANEQNSWHKASLKFAEELDRLTEGRIAVEVFPNDSLGREMDLINGMQLGTVEMTITGESLQNWAPMAALLAIPYAYQSLEHMDEVAGGEIGTQIEAQVIERAQVRPIAYFARGPRNLTANHPITSPAELNRMRLRVPNVPLFVDTWTALGAQPTPMAFSEVFTSLQNGTIGGQENPLALIQAASLNEVQSHVNQTEHVRSWIYLTIAEQVWQRLSQEDQAHVLEAARIAQEFEREQFLQDEDAIRADLEAKGMTFVEVDQKAFADGSRDAVINSVDESIRPIVQDLFNH